MSIVNSIPLAGSQDIVMSRHGAKQGMLLPLGDSTAIVEVGNCSLRWLKDDPLTKEGGSLRFEFRDGRSPFAQNEPVLESETQAVVNGGFFTYDVFLTKPGGAVEVFRGCGGVEAKPKPA